MRTVARETPKMQRIPQGLVGGAVCQEIIMNAIHEPKPEIDTRISPPLSQGSDAVDRARQGVVSGRVLTVLLTSFTLAVIALAVTYFVT